MNYLDVSVLYPYAAGPGNVFAGLNIGINLTATQTVGDADAVDLKENDDVINALDYGLLVGYTYPINETMGVSAGYYLGLADWSGNGGADDDPSSDKHNGIVVNVDELWEMNRSLEREYEIDTEVLFALVQNSISTDGFSLESASKFLLQEQIIDSFISENYVVIQATGKKSRFTPAIESKSTLLMPPTNIMYHCNHMPHLA